MDTSNLLSVDQLNSLLRLYLAWPEIITNDLSREANEFYLWLSVEFDEGDLARTTGGLAGVKTFINANEKVLSGARYLKGQARNQGDHREDARISVNTQLFFLVYDCTKAPELEGTILRGIVLDLAGSGMRVEANIPVPAGTIISMAVIETGYSSALYYLTGEVRWASEHAETNHLGIHIFNIEDYKRWQDFYYLMSLEY